MMMPYIGYYTGLAFINYIQKIDHWIAFGILLCIGLNMIFSKEKDDNNFYLTWKSLFLLSIEFFLDLVTKF